MLFGCYFHDTSENVTEDFELLWRLAHELDDQIIELFLWGTSEFAKTSA